jgi:hypothetical protein
MSEPGDIVCRLRDAITGGASPELLEEAASTIERARLHFAKMMGDRTVRLGTFGDHLQADSAPVVIIDHEANTPR